MDYNRKYMSVKDITREFSQIPNEVLDAVMRPELDSYDSKVLLYIVRKTYGYNRDFDEISLQQFEKDLGFSKQRVLKSHRKLESLGDIFIHRYEDKKRVKHNIFFMATDTSVQVIEALNSGAVDPTTLMWQRRLISGDNLKARKRAQQMGEFSGGSVRDTQGGFARHTGVVCATYRGSLRDIHTKDNPLKTNVKDSIEKGADAPAPDVKKSKKDLQKEVEAFIRECFELEWNHYPHKRKKREALTHYLSHTKNLTMEQAQSVHQQSMNAIATYSAYVLLNDTPQDKTFRGYNYYKNAMWDELVDTELPQALKGQINAQSIANVKTIVEAFKTSGSENLPAQNANEALNDSERNAISIICRKAGRDYLRVVKQMQGYKRTFVNSPETLQRELPSMHQFFLDPNAFAETYPES